MTQPATQPWTRDRLAELYNLPLTELVFRAQSEHRRWHDPTKVQLATLLSIKTGGCPEDCAYCPQSAHYQTGVSKQALMPVQEVVEAAQRAKAMGATRFCMGAAWRQVRDGAEFDRVVEMVGAVAGLDLEVCCTLGMLSASQAERLAAAGLTAYNHNLDTGPQYYDRIISTRTYDDRLKTLDHVRGAGLSVCCGGIIGMGEDLSDRLDLLCVLANMPNPPESVPINALVRVAGTPLQHQQNLDPFELVRMVALARLAMPKSKVRLSAGRKDLSAEAQALCFMAGANSIFAGDTLLTTPNPSEHEDFALLQRLGLSPLEAA